jgi:hypothetical protein
MSYGLNLEYLKGSYVKGFIPRVVLLGGGGTFRRWSLVRDFLVIEECSGRGF